MIIRGWDCDYFYMGIGVNIDRWLEIEFFGFMFCS